MDDSFNDNLLEIAMSVQTVASLSSTAPCFSPFVPRATSPIPVVCGLLFACVGLYAIKTLCGRCCLHPSMARDQLIYTARDNWKSRDVSKQVDALQIFSAYVAKGEHYATALPVAQAAIVCSNEQIRLEGCALFRALFRKGEGRLEAITAVLNGRASADTYKASEASLTALFPSPLEFARSLQIHEESIAKTLSLTERHLLGLKSFVVVVEAGETRSYPAALDAAEEALHASTASLREQAGLILAALFKKNFRRDHLKRLYTNHHLNLHPCLETFSTVS